MTNKPVNVCQTENVGSSFGQYYTVYKNTCVRFTLVLRQ